MKKLIALSLFLGSMHTASADVMHFTDNGTSLTDGHTAGLEWLDVTASVNRSYNDVSSQFGVGGDYEGWRYATGDEFNQLISNWRGLSSPITTGSIVNAPEGEIDALVEAMGSTIDTYYMELHSVTYDTYYGYAEGEGLDYTYGILGDSYFGRKSAIIYDDDINGAATDFSASNFGWIDDRWAASYFGSYLVKSTVATVSAPATLALLGLGLAGLSFTRRRKGNS